MNIFKDFDILENFFDSNQLGEMESCYITDTRLMGVLGIHGTWQVKGNNSEKFHRFFYIDCEDNGLERYLEYFGNDEHQLEIRFQSIIGGLGAKLLSINEAQLNIILAYYTRMKNLKTSLDMVNPVDNLEAEIIKVEAEIITKEVKLFNENSLKDASVPDELIWESINYMIMRLTAHDILGALLINIDISETTLPPKGTLMKNFIDDSFDDGIIMCESLIEAKGQYHIATFQLSTLNGIPISCNLKKVFPISEIEAALILRNEEYLVTLNFHGNFKKIDYTICDEFYWSTSMENQKGHLMMLYNENNDHIKSRDYYLSDDYYGAIFFTKYREAVVMAKDINDADNIIKLLFINHIVETRYNHNVTIVNSLYPVFHGFIHNDTKEFIDHMIKEENKF